MVGIESENYFANYCAQVLDKKQIRTYTTELYLLGLDPEKFTQYNMIRIYGSEINNYYLKLVFYQENCNFRLEGVIDGEILKKIFIYSSSYTDKEKDFLIKDIGVHELFGIDSVLPPYTIFAVAKLEISVYYENEWYCLDNFTEMSDNKYFVNLCWRAFNGILKNPIPYLNSGLLFFYYIFILFLLF